MTVGARLRVPVPRRTLVARPRLANPFINQPLPRLVLLCAAAGSGKTTLLQQWLAQVVAEPGPFRTTGCAGRLGQPGRVGRRPRAVPDRPGGRRRGGRRCVGRPRLLLADGRAEPEDVMVGLVEDLDGAAGLTVIALDDLHLMTTGQAATDAFAFLIDNLPPRVVVAATSRTDPAVPLARLRARAANWSKSAMPTSDSTTPRPRRSSGPPWASTSRQPRSRRWRPEPRVGGRTPTRRGVGPGSRGRGAGRRRRLHPGVQRDAPIRARLPGAGSARRAAARHPHVPVAHLGARPAVGAVAPSSNIFSRINRALPR